MKIKKKLSFILIFFQVITFLNFGYFINNKEVKAEENSQVESIYEEGISKENEIINTNEEDILDQSISKENEKTNTIEENKSNETEKVDNSEIKPESNVEIVQSGVSTFASDAGWISYNEANKRLEVKIEGMIPTTPNTEYEYDIFGFVIRYSRGDGAKYLTQVAANTSSESSGFVLVPGSYKQYVDNGRTYETAINSLSLYNLKAIFETDFPGVDFSEITDPTRKAVFVFDAIYSVKSPGQSSYRGGVNANRYSFGEYYMTLNGTHSYNQYDYNRSSKYTNLSYYDTLKGGVIGSKLYDMGTEWISVAKTDIRNNYNKSLTITGDVKPDIPKTVVIKYLDKDTGYKLAAEESYTYYVGSTSVSKTYSAKSVSNYTYSYFKIDTGGGLGSQNTSKNASIDVYAGNSKHEIIFYYKKSSSEKSIVIKGIDYSTKNVLYQITVEKTITSDQEYWYSPKSISGYTYDHYTNNYGNGWSGWAYGNGYLWLSVDGNHYELNLYYNANGVSSPTPSGSITFSPSSTGWQNSNIDVTVTVSGDTEIKRTGSQLRSYSYQTRDWNFGYYKDEVSNGQTIKVWVPGWWGDYYTVNSSAYCIYEQVWEISGITVSVDSAKDINNNAKSVSLSSTSLTNGGTTTIQSEAKDIGLKASLSGWKEKSKNWSSASAPNGGTWGTTALTSSTNKPTETYDSTSGSFYLDKTKPVIQSVSSPSANWSNKDIKVDASFSDNLSGLKSYNVYFSDSSHIKNTDITLTLNNLGISNSRYNYDTSYTLNKDGMYALNINLEDNAGNTQTKTQQTFKLDKTKPNAATFSNDSRTYIDSDLVVTIGVSDNLSGIAKVEMAVTNSETYKNETKTNLNLTTTENVKDKVGTYNHTINSNGTYYFHVWSYDRAGNETYTVSKGYKYFKINPEDININPYGDAERVMRGTRFDVITNISKFTEEDFNNSTITYSMPYWIKDDVNKKANGKYYASIGFGEKTTAKQFNESNSLQLWDSYSVPFGAILTYDRQGNKIGSEYKVEIVLEYNDYVFGPKKTHITSTTFSVIPEQVIKTQIIYNE